MSKVRSVTSAEGVKGFIMHGVDMDGGAFYFFRVYNKDFTFIDYDITHHDLEVQILGTDTVLYSSEFGNYIDYPPIDESK
jgi:hypothetical protein